MVSMVWDLPVELSKAFAAGRRNGPMVEKDGDTK
jgi:hypothetical protein